MKTATKVAPMGERGEGGREGTQEGRGREGVRGRDVHRQNMCVYYIG